MNSQSPFLECCVGDLLCRDPNPHHRRSFGYCWLRAYGLITRTKYYCRRHGPVMVKRCRKRRVRVCGRNEKRIVSGARPRPKWRTTQRRVPRTRAMTRSDRTREFGQTVLAAVMLRTRGSRAPNDWPTAAAVAAAVATDYEQSAVLRYK